MKVNNLINSAQKLKDSNQLPATPNLIHKVLTKIGFGVNAADESHIKSLPGNSEKEKILAYIDEQLKPEKIRDDKVNKMFSKGFQTLSKSRKELFQDHVRRPDKAKISHWYKRLPRFEATIATYIRSTHSKKQLFETMVDFWHNHFNIHAWNKYTQAMIMNYDVKIIRKNALGNFRDMLMDVSMSTCMLHYLGNGYNEKTAPNENFARELLELYTISANHYYGHMPATDVKVDSAGHKIGFVETDVLELARMLTGWSFSGAVDSDYTKGQSATGEFLYRPEWQDVGPKTIMGHEYHYNKCKPLKNYHSVLDKLAAHPATSEHLATKLCQRFISDKPPNNLVQRVKRVLQKHWQAPNQIQLGMEELLKSNEFLHTWGEKNKRPFELLVSSMRQMEYSYDFNPENPETREYFKKIIKTGQAPFNWSLPTGYPDEKQMWLGFSSTMNTWKLIQWMTAQLSDNRARYNQIVQITKKAFPNPNEVNPQNIVSYWYYRSCGRHPDSSVANALINFMAKDHIFLDSNSGFEAPVDLDTNQWPDYNQDRLISVVSTIFLTTDFRLR